MIDAYSFGQILWSADPATVRAILLVLIVFAAATVTIYLPLIVRLLRLARLERKLRRLAVELTPSAAQALLADFKKLLVASSETLDASLREALRMR